MKTCLPSSIYPEQRNNAEQKTEREPAWKHCLRTGDEFFWSDPDEGTCSRVVRIQTIEYTDERTIRVMESNGNVLECYLNEIS